MFHRETTLLFSSPASIWSSESTLFFPCRTQCLSLLQDRTWWHSRILYQSRSSSPPRKNKHRRIQQGRGAETVCCVRFFSSNRSAICRNLFPLCNLLLLKYQQPLLRAQR